ncbi:uncharacterized protein G2W53_038882 [Senna tora]|uniref:Uncharacterized protein n=1 Tax=Senna tora TaxID=362788 RepID=A0A834W5M7_9FABA|nr:uncharacterized protein G2W53_038882 [Senna tora]
MSEPQPPPPPLPRTEFLMKRCKLLWRLLLISNFAVAGCCNMSCFMKFHSFF